MAEQLYRQQNSCHLMGLGYNILLLSELGVKNIWDHVTKLYVQVTWLIWFQISTFPGRFLIPFSNSIMGQLLASVLDTRQLWPLLSFFPRMFAHSGISIQLYSVYSARPFPGVNQHNCVNIRGGEPVYISFNGFLSVRCTWKQRVNEAR